MEKLPAEILHLIFRNLPRREVTKLRKVNRAFAAVAAYYLIENVFFHTSHASLKRLKLIADHPVFHQTVKEITYEAYTIREIGDEDQYFRYFEFDWHYAKDRPKPLSTNPTKREKRLHDRNQVKFRNKIDSNFLTYRSLFDEQQKLFSQEALHELVGKNVLKFRNLEKITFLPVRQCIHMTSARCLKEYGNNSAVPLSPAPLHTPLQVGSLLIPSGSFNKKLRCINIDLVDPSFFGDVANRRSILAAFKQLRQVYITLRSHGFEVPNFKDKYVKFLSQGILRDALAGAKDLTDLALITNSPDADFMDNQLLLADNTWPNLKRLGLESVSTTQMQLTTILKKHPKLETLGLTFIELREGDWPDTILELHRHLTLTEFKCRGFLKDPEEIWDVDLLDELAYRDGLHFTLAEALQDYVCSKSVHLSDEEFDGCDECGDSCGHPLLHDYDSFMPLDFLEEIHGNLSDEDQDFLDMEFGLLRYPVDTDAH